MTGGSFVGKIRTSARVSIVAIALLGLASLVVAALPAASAEARSGAARMKSASPGDVVFHEGFEEGSGVTALRNFTGANGIKYTGDLYWTVGGCNGLIRSSSDSLDVPISCPSGDTYAIALAAQLAYAVGGASRALTSTTATEGSAGVILETSDPIGVGSSMGRFLGVGFRAAAVSCDLATPGFGVQLNGATVASGLDPCSGGSSVSLPQIDPSDKTTASVRWFTTSGSILVGSSQLDLKMTDSSGHANGNDWAIDDIEVIDWTPTLSPSFATSVVPVGQSVKLVYTVTNTPESAEKDGWNFTVPLPTGLTVASPSNASSTCGSASVTADASATQVSAKGNLSGASCTVSVDVTSSTAGSYTTDFRPTTALANSALTGLDRAGSSTVTFTPPPISLTKTAVPVDSNSDGIVDLGDSISYNFSVTNGGNAPISNVTVNDPLLSGGVTCLKTSLAAKESTTCTSNSPYLLTQADATARKVSNSATVSANDSGGNLITSPAATAEVTVVAPAPSIGLLKTAHVPTGQSKVGDVVSLGYSVSNTGNVPLSSVAVTETGFSGAGAPPVVSCPKTTLAANTSMDCSATYSVVQADIDSGAVSGPSRVVGVSPQGVSVQASSSAAVSLSTAGALKLTTTSKLNGNAIAGATVGYEFAVVNTGNTTVSGLQIREDMFTGTGTLGAITCPVSTLAPGNSTTCTAAYVLTAADVSAGRIQNAATALGTTHQGLVTSVAASNELHTGTSAISLSKSADEPIDVNGDGTTDVDDTIAYSFTVSNDGDTPLSGIAVSDRLSAGGVACLATSLAPKGQTTCTSKSPYRVTSADVAAGNVHNVATASAIDVLGDPVSSEPATADVLAQVPAPSVGLVKAAQVPAGQSKVGNAVAFSYRVSNTGNVRLSNLAVTDTAFSGASASAGAAPVVTCPNRALEIHESMDCWATYSVAQTDIDAGEVSGTAVAVGDPPTGTAVQASSEATAALSTAGGVELTKTSRLDGVSVAGAAVEYDFTAVNTGNTTVSDLQVREDTFTGTGTVGAVSCPVSELAPGESTVCRASYVLTATDVSAGRIQNTATVSAMTGQGLVTSVASVNELRLPPAALALTGATISLGGLAAALLLIFAGAVIATTRRREGQR